MIRPLNKRERQAHHAENPLSGDRGQEMCGWRVGIALDRENQPSAEARERVVRMRAHEAQRWETTL